MARKRVGCALAGVLVAALAGCGSSGTYSVHPINSILASGLAAANHPPMDVLPVPGNARPWPTNTNTLLSRVAFVQAFYTKDSRTEEEALFQRRGFVSGVYEGWFNPDGSQQLIAVMRFASPAGALSEFNGLTTTLKSSATASEIVSDHRDGGTGAVDPTADSLGNTRVELATRLGDYVIDVGEYVPVTPDPGSAETLLLKQYQYFKSTHPGSAT